MLRHRIFFWWDVAEGARQRRDRLEQGPVWKATRMRKDDQYTIAFDAAAEEALREAMSLTNCKTVPDVIRTALACFIDLLDAEQKNLAIIFRDTAKGSEWGYSPRKPGQAVALPKRGAKGALPSAAASPVRIGISSWSPSEGLRSSVDNVLQLPTHPRR
jgi:hypothetical protein